MPYSKWHLQRVTTLPSNARRLRIRTEQTLCTRIALFRRSPVSSPSSHASSLENTRALSPLRRRRVLTLILRSRSSRRDRNFGSSLKSHSSAPPRQYGSSTDCFVYYSSSDTNNRLSWLSSRSLCKSTTSKSVIAPASSPSCLHSPLYTCLVRPRQV